MSTECKGFILGLNFDTFVCLVRVDGGMMQIWEEVLWGVSEVLLNLYERISID